MNINDNLNNQITPNRQAGRPQNTRSGDQVRSRARVETTDATMQNSQAEAPGQVRDTVNLSGGSRYIEELTDTAERVAEEPREDMVARATARVATGEYNSPDFIRRIAESLLDTTFPND